MGARVIPIARGRTRDVEGLLHDMRNPLAVIRGQCHAIVRCANRPDALIDRLRLIDGEVDRVVAAIDRVRSALHGVDRDPPPGPVDLVAVVHEAARRHEGSATELGVALRIESHADHAEVTGRSDELHRLVDNLISNAIRHAPHGTAVTLALTDRDRHVALRVSDRGAGIDAEERPWIFDRHARRNGAAGWGIGLAIAGDIAARHHGRIALDPGDGGASFRVELPASGRAVRMGAR